MKKRIIFFGSIPLARECLEIVLAQNEVELVGVCTVPMGNSWRTEESVWEYCSQQSLPVIEHDEIPHLEPDLGISVRYHQILKPETLSAFKDGVVNIHGGLLPEYRGSYCNIHALINNESEFGVTLHYLDSGVDTGDIVERRSLQLKPEDTGLSLYRKGEILCLEVINNNIRPLIEDRANRIPQQVLIQNGAVPHEYKRASLDQLKAIPYDELRTERAHRIIRAFDSPHHEPAFTMFNGNKVYLRTSWRDESSSSDD